MPIQESLAVEVGPLTTSKHDLLFVSGLAGAGKSTFLDMLEKGLLPSEVKRALPEGSEHWTIVDKDGCPKGSKTPLTSKMIRHYDTVAPFRKGIQEFKNHSALRMLERSSAPVVILIAPPVEQLLDQFENRYQMQSSKKSALRLFLRRRVRLPIRRAMHRLKLRTTGPATEDLYGDQSWISRCCRQWEDYLSLLLAQKPNARLIRIIPCRDKNNQPTFRLSDT